MTANAPIPGSSLDVADVDGGRTTLTSPVFDLSGMATPALRYWRWFSNHSGAVPAAPDTLRVDLSNNAGASWVAVERVSESAPWTEVQVLVSQFLMPTSQMRLRVVAEDVGTASIVEAAFDDFMAFDAPVSDVATPVRPGRLRPVVPNPFNPRARIRFELASAGRVHLLVLDVRGRLVRRLLDATLGSGSYEKVWDGRDGAGRALPSGRYWVQLVAPGCVESRSAVLLR